MAIHHKSLSRRSMLKGAAGLVIGLHLPLDAAKAQSGAAQVFTPDTGAAAFAPNAFVRIGADDTVTVLIKHIEFGQGPFTGPRHAGRRGAGRRLVEGARRARAVQSRPLQEPGVRRSGHGRLQRDRQLLRADAQGRRDGARHAGRGSGAGLARAGRRDHRRARRAASRQKRAQGPVRAVRASRGAAAGAGERAAQGPGAVPADRPRGRGQEARQRRQVQRHGAVHHRHPRARHAHGGRRAAAPLRRQGRVVRGRRCAARCAAWSTSKQIPSGVAVYADGMWPALKGREKLRVTWDEASRREAQQRRSSSRSTARLSRKPGTVAGQHGDAEAALARERAR